MKTMKLKPDTKINAILVVDKKNPNVAMSQNLNMTLLEWTMHFSMSDKCLDMKLPNLLDFTLKYERDGSNNTHKMSSYIYDDNNYKVFVNVFDK